MGTDEEPENRIRWWVRHAIVPVIGSGGIVALAIAFFADGGSSTTPIVPLPPDDCASTVLQFAKGVCGDPALAQETNFSTAGDCSPIITGQSNANIEIFCGTGGDTLNTIVGSNSETFTDYATCIKQMVTESIEKLC